eukprot:gene7909-11141_t
MTCAAYILRRGAAAAVLENVPNFTKAPLFRKFCDRLSAAGYA